MPVPEEFRQAEKVRDPGAKCDQCVHRRRPAVPQRTPGTFEELTSKAEHDECAQGGENPIHPGGPHHPGHRKGQHRKGQRRRTDQIEQRKVALGLIHRWPYLGSWRGAIACLLDGGDQV